MVKIGYIYGSYRKIKTRVPLFWNTLYVWRNRPMTCGWRITKNEDEATNSEPERANLTPTITVMSWIFVN